MSDADDAAERWAAMLARWAIPDDLLAAAPESPYFFDPTVFTEAADAALARDVDSPSDVVARQALPSGGTVLDVGAGAGAASLRLDAGHIVGVDPSRELLEAFAERAARRGITATVIQGHWPDVAAQTPTADVVVCHHVFYNVAALGDFSTALSAHADVRVVVELTTVHPLAWMAPYWKALHGLTQPARPTVEDAIAVLTALGLHVHDRRWERDMQMIGEHDDAVARIARRLCLPAARHDELRRVLTTNPPPHRRGVATLWWDRRRSGRRDERAPTTI